MSRPMLLVELSFLVVVASCLVVAARSLNAAVESPGIYVDAEVINELAPPAGVVEVRAAESAEPEEEANIVDNFFLWYDDF